MMRGKFIFLISFLVLAFACTSHADVVIGDFEGDLGNWVAGWDDSPVLELSDIGVTSGSSSLALSVSPGWAWALQWNAPEGFDISNYHTVSADVTWVASEWEPQDGIWVQFQIMAVNSEGPSGWSQSTCTDTVNADYPGSWDPVNWGDQTRTLTWDISGYDATGSDWLQIIFSVNNGGVTTMGKYYIDNIKLIGEEPVAGPKVIWVTETADRDEGGVQDDQEWIDKITAAGYDLVVQPDRYLTMGDEQDPNDANDYVAELNAAQLVIISRTASSGGYNNDANEIAAWASVTAPMISLSAYHVRSSRLQWIDSTTVNRSLDTYILALDEGHAIFDGVTLEDGLVEMLFTEGFAAEYMGNCVIGSLDAGNGTVIAQTFSDETVIAEWPAGVAGYEGADVVQAGPRLLLCAGTQDTAGAVGQGEWNLSAAGEQVFFNAVDYMISLAPKPPRVLLEDDFEGDAIDTAKWQLVNGADVNIVQADGQVFFDRPETQLNYLVTAEQYNPAETPLIISGSAVTGPEGLAVWTRAANIGNTADSAKHVLDSGIRIPLWPEGENNWWYDAEIIEKTAGTWPWSGLTVGNIPGEKAYDWDFVITDDGATVTATYTQTSDPTNTFTVTADTATEFGTNYVALTVINGYLNDVKISTTAPLPPLPIDVENFSFELPGTGKQKCWDGENLNSETSDDPNDYFEDVPGWSSDTAASDSGVEGPNAWPGTTDGEWAGYIMGDDPSVWNLTDYAIVAGEEYLLQVDLQDNWTEGGLPDVVVSIFYDNAGTRVTVASVTVTPPDQSEGGWEEVAVSFVADDVPDSIGKQIGVEIDGLSYNSWIGIDNVRLGVVQE